jgi:hypothetical protein
MVTGWPYAPPPPPSFTHWFIVTFDQLRRAACQWHARRLPLPHSLPLVLHVSPDQEPRAVSFPPHFPPPSRRVCHVTCSCVWGGCMMFRSPDLKSDAYARAFNPNQTLVLFRFLADAPHAPSRSFSMISHWIEGGYSDDMIVGAVCKQHNRGIGWLPTLLFPSRCRSPPPPPLPPPLPLLDHPFPQRRRQSPALRKLHPAPNVCPAHLPHANGALGQPVHNVADVHHQRYLGLQYAREM